MTRLEAWVLLLGAVLVVAGVATFDVRLAVVLLGIALVLSAVDLKKLVKSR